MQKTEFIFTAAKRGESDYSCSDGQIERLRGARFLPDGSIAALPALKAVTVPEPPEPLPPLQCPEVECGLVRITVPGTLYTYAGVNSSILAKAKNIDEMVMDAYSRHRLKIAAAGAFGSPFFVRCALRLFDDSIVLPTVPVQMLPWVLPPCLGIDLRPGANDNTDVRVDLSEVRACQLRLRLRSAIDPALSGIVKSMEVYVTKPADLCGATGNGCIDRYSNVAGSGVAGVYSTDGVHFAVHSVASLALGGMEVWSVSRPADFTRRMRCPGTFFHAASIPFAEIEVNTGFDIVVPCPDFAAAAPMPEAMELPPEPFLAMTEGDGRVYAVPERLAVPKAQSLRGAVAFTGDASAPSVAATTITVLSGCDGVNHASSTVVFGRVLAGAFPFFIYHEDPRATLMEIRQNGRVWQLPMRACGTGAAWWRQPDDPEPVQLSAGMDVSGMPDSYPAGNILYVSPPGNPRCMARQPVRIGNGTVYGLSHTAGSLSPGYFGSYILYAFASDGIYAVNRNLSHATLISVACVWPGALVQMLDNCTACVTGRRLLVVKGLKVKMLALPAVFERVGVFDECLLLVGDQPLLYNPDNDSFTEIPGPVPEAWEEDPEACMPVEVLTRPLKLGDVGPLKALRQVEVRGSAACGRVSCAVYGSRDMLHWHLLASARRRAFTLSATTPCRAFKLRVVAEIDRCERLYGAYLSFM